MAILSIFYSGSLYTEGLDYLLQDGSAWSTVTEVTDFSILVMFFFACAQKHKTGTLSLSIMLPHVTYMTSIDLGLHVVTNVANCQLP